LGIRKNQSALSVQEKQNFVDALIALKVDGTYDRFVQVHVDAMATPTPPNVSTMTRNAAHRGPAFLPWHREFLRRLELELQRIDSSVDLPYWDWTVDNTIGASIFSDNFMGGNGNTSNGNIVETGSFGTNAGNWPLNIDGPSLRRTISSSVSLPTTSQVNSCLGVTPYDSSPWDATSDPASSFRNRLEGWRGDGNIHNRVHVWVGGSMTLGSSPNDPLFFMHHCNIDRLWALWQQQHPTECYAPTSGTNTDQNLNDPMFPWMSTITPASVIDISALGYSYDNVPQGPICSGGGSSGGGSSGGGSSGGGSSGGGSSGGGSSGGGSSGGGIWWWKFRQMFYCHCSI